MLALCFLTLGVPTLEPGYIHVRGKVMREPVKKSFQWELHAELLARGWPSCATDIRSPAS